MRFVHYKNGNYTVAIDLEDGTKIRKNDLDFFRADFPESMDIKITNKCDMGCTFCLNSSAKLNVEGESKNISDINIGDKVLSFNIENQISEYQSVKRLFKHKYTGTLIVITDALGNTIKCTPNHKLYTKNRGYVRADELTVDDLLVIN